MKNNPLKLDSKTRELLLPHCRLWLGEVWEDPNGRHQVTCADAAQITPLTKVNSATLAIHDPPYNFITFSQQYIDLYIKWCESWVRTTEYILHKDASLYIWLGANQNNHFEPLPQFMTMMEQLNLFSSRSFITMRNQRGYGTQKNWMATRQELLYYTKGSPSFNVQYTEIPKILKGYYKDIDGKRVENTERSKSNNIRSSNVWVDIQQVFYRMKENVSGCYAQKPLKAIERIILASSKQDDLVLDFFSHSGTTLLACERLGRRCMAVDIDPIYCEISIRRLENFRKTGQLGWQNGNPFEDVIN